PSPLRPCAGPSSTRTTPSDTDADRATPSAELVPPMHDSQPLRLSILAIVAVALFTALLSRLWFLQVMAAPEYQAAAEANRTRTIVVEGPRGRILDRNGVVLADNREAVVVTVDA